jgi:hypothetical protein
VESDAQALDGARDEPVVWLAHCPIVRVNEGNAGVYTIISNWNGPMMPEARERSVRRLCRSFAAGGNRASAVLRLTSEPAFSKRRSQANDDPC